MIRKSSAVAAAALLALALAGPAAANVLRVDDDGLDPFECEGAPYRTIAAALAAAQPGDEIRICPGVYAEQVVLTQQLRLTGISFGTAKPVIRPTALPATRESLLGRNLVTAAIIADIPITRISNLEIDLSASPVSTCLPFLTGVYLRGTSGAVDGLDIHDVRVVGAPDCNSGVALYVESGPIDEVLGNPIFAPVRVNIRDVETRGYQKAGVVVNGPRATALIRGGSATGLGPTAGAVQYGYQVAYGAKARLADVVAEGHRSLRAGKAAAGVLVFRSDRAAVRKSEIRLGQEGVLGIGNRLRVKKTSLVDMSADGVVFFGDSNVAASIFVNRSSVSGVFINGDINTVRGGLMRDMPVGVWFQNGTRSKFGGVRFENVPVHAQGVYGGVRWELNLDSAVPFTTECAAAADCNDGNGCTGDTCDDGHCVFTTLAVGTACDDGNSCTTADTCAAGATCQGTAAAQGTACDDGDACTQLDTCDAAGACVGTASPLGVSCDDGNACTVNDVCTDTGCRGFITQAPCDDGNACTTGDTCDGFGVCQGLVAPLGAACDDGNECTRNFCSAATCRSENVNDGTSCAAGTLTCTAGVCS